MTAKDNALDPLMERLCDEVVKNLKQSVTDVVERELSRSLTKALVQGEFYRRLSDEMRQGLQSIYKELSSARKEGSGQGELVQEKLQADQLFHEAADQLDKILSTTEQATGEIMDIVEKHQDIQARSNAVLHSLKSGGVTKEQLAELRSVSDVLNEDLIKIMTTLSFQDLTGQRIKRIIEAIKKVEGIVLDLYLSTGLELKAHQEAPEKSLDDIQADAKRTVSELKGPQVGVGQGAVDDLLAQLGM